MMIKILLAFSLVSLPSFCADWSPRLAANYLDSREKDWFAWNHAQTPGGPCVSCHTGILYLLARPELRRKLGEPHPTVYETGLLNGLRTRVAGTTGGDVFPAAFSKEPLASQAIGVEAIHAALLLGSESALDRMWSLQRKDGAWNWFHLDLDPWETPDSTFYGATLAAIAAGNASSEHKTAHREQIALLIDYLHREQATQPLHNRLMLLWASAKMPEIAIDKEALMDEVWKLQQPDGGWSIESLGPWKRPSRSAGSDAYATAFTAYALKKGLNPSNMHMNRALNWLKTHQNREYGYWPSTSMNKQYEPGSMMEKFMQDAATGFAALALLD